MPARKLAQQLALNPLMGAMLMDRAEKVAEAAVSIAPEGDSPAGEHYKDQIKPLAKITSKRGGWLGRVNAFKFTSHWVEFGTSHTPAFAVLRRASEMVGLTFRARRRRR